MIIFKELKDTTIDDIDFRSFKCKKYLGKKLVISNN